MTTEEIESGKALFLVKSARVYRPSEVPPKVQEKACEREHAHVEPSNITECLVDSYLDEFQNRGIEFREFRKKGKPEIYWTTYPTAVGLSVVVTDLAKFAQSVGIAAPDVRRLLDDDGDVSLSTTAEGRDGTVTRPHADSNLPEIRDRSKNERDKIIEQRAIAGRLATAWTDYVTGLLSRMRKSLEEIMDYETSWDRIQGDLEANEMGVDSEGNWVPLSECRTEGSGYNVGD